MNLHRSNVTLPNGSTRTFVNFEDAVSAQVAVEVLTGKSYPLIRNFVPRLVIDIGAHVGSAAMFFHSAYQNATVVSFEPHPGSFTILKANVDGIEQIEPHNQAVTTTKGTAKLFSGSIGPCGFNLQTGKESLSVEATSLPEIIHTYRIPDCLKIDTEGHECKILASVSQTTRDKIDVIYVEYHTEADRREIDHLLKNHILVHASAYRPACGELCYATKAVLDSSSQ